MASSAEKKWSCAKQIESNLRKLLSEGRPTFNDIDQKIHEFRTSCQETIFLDFHYAAREYVGRRLWDLHTMINVRYRKLLEQYRKGDQKLLVVERRKVEKHYADFLKTSQYFYKGFVQRLASHFGGMPKLERVAHCMHLDLLSVQERTSVSTETARLLESACHAVLLRLGDLSRYRNMIKTKNRSWEPALGYYSLANDLYPDDGTAHNQMAVVALADQNHLDAVYHLFRATTAIEPHPLARGNLEIEFKKIISAWEKNRMQKKNMDSLETLVWWFVLLHSKFYEGVKFSTHFELENEVLSRLALLLKEQSFDDTLQKFVLVSIAAQCTAISRINEEEGRVRRETIQSFYFCLGFNIHTMIVLLRVLLAEVTEESLGEEPSATAGESDASNKVSTTARRIIPALRQYSIWLANSCELILTVSDDEGNLKDDAVLMWKLYAEVLTRIASFFPIFSITPVEYLLEEDANTVGFEPFRNTHLSDACNFYCVQGKIMKPRFTDPGVERQDLKSEMQSRLLNIVVTAVSLASEHKIPLELNGRCFSYIENPMAFSSADLATPRLSSSVDAAHSTPLAEQSSRPREVDCPTPPGYGHQPYASYAVEPVGSSAVSDSIQSMDTDMHRMVDNLLGPHLTSVNETSYGMHSLTANEVFAPLGSNGYGNRLQSTPTMLPSLPGLFTTAFTPQANELQPSSPHRPSTARQLSPLSLSTKEKRISAAAALDEMTGFSSDPSSSWGRRPSRFSSNPVSQSVNQSLQESLSRQFMSSEFTDSSSMYPDATQQRFNAGRAIRAGPFAANGNDSTTYAGASDFDKTTMLQSSLWNGSQPSIWGGYVQTPPGGQGG